jgi:exopolyphosphatase/guanosine-5'-triphosphate,3'-diphosphate pyrophosphatase
VAEKISTCLRDREAQLKADAEKELARFDRGHWQSLNEHLAKRTGNIPLEGLIFQHLALERWMEAREFHRKALRNRSAASWHQLRIGIKRLRYTLENFLPQRHERWAKDLRNLQDALGEVHDFDVLRAMISAHPGIPGDEIALWDKRLFSERQKRLQFYRSKMVGRETLWQQWRSELPKGAKLEKAGLEKLRKWASFLDPDIRHSRLVARLAMALYDGLSHCGTISSTLRSRQILFAGAMLHEVGRSKMAGGHGGHRKRARRAVMQLEPPLAWSDEDLHILAALVRYHRGALPPHGSSHIVAIARERRSELMLLIGVLRLANALDEQHDGKVSKLTVVQQDGAVVLSVQGLAKMSREAEHVARARYLLETLCGCPFVIREQRAAPAAFRRERIRKRTGGAA